MKIHGIVTISKYKKNFQWTYVISDLKGEEIVGTCYKKITKNRSKEFRVEKVIKGKDDILYVK